MSRPCTAGQLKFRGSAEWLARRPATAPWNQGDPAMEAKIRTAPFDQWFKDEALLAEQYKLVPVMVTAEVLQGL